MNKKDVFAAFVFFVYSIISVLLIERWQDILWFCNHVPIIFLVFYLTGKKKFMKSFINMGLIIQSSFFITIVLNWVFGVQWMPLNGRWIYSLSPLMFVAALFHHSSSLFAMVMIRDVKSDDKTLINSFLYGIILYTAGFFLGKGYNCFRGSCFPGNFNAVILISIFIYITHNIQKFIENGSKQS